MSLIAGPMHLSRDLQPLNVGCSSFTEDVSQYCYCSFVIVYIGERGDRMLRDLCYDGHKQAGEFRQ